MIHADTLLAVNSCDSADGAIETSAHYKFYHLLLLIIHDYLSFIMLAVRSLVNLAYTVHRRWSGVSRCCFTHLKQSTTSRHFIIISTDLPKKRLKPFLFIRSFPDP